MLVLAAATLAGFLAGCGQPGERTGATSAGLASPVAVYDARGASLTPGTRASSAYGTRDASLTPGAAAPDIASADTAASATSLASTSTLRPAQATVEKRKRESNSSAHDPLSSFELVGTGIDGTHAFAVVRTPDQSAVTVREGGVIGRYTVRRIQPDRIRLQAQDEKEAMLVIGVAGSAEQASPSTTEMTPGEANAVSAFLAAGIDTDQSIPAQVVYGPTARWPEGVKHVH